MVIDYPAAHSMDTYWFAVDDRGQVAVFDTGEDGHAPEGVLEQDFDFYRLVDLWHGEDQASSLEENARKIGLYYYDYGDYSAPAIPYARVAIPPVPLHVDQLPPHFRTKALSNRFALRFDQAERVQPQESRPCVSYRGRVAYVCTDGVTVRPIPGREGEFAEFVRLWRKQQPDVAARFRFEGPSE